MKPVLILYILMLLVFYLIGAFCWLDLGWVRGVLQMTPHDRFLLLVIFGILSFSFLMFVKLGWDR